MRKTLFLLSFALVSATCLPQAAAAETTYTQDTWPDSSEVTPEPTSGGNTIIIDGVQDTNGEAYGGYAYDDSAVANNQISIKNGSSLNTVAGGGSSTANGGSADKNIVNISEKSQVKSVYGGITEYGTSTCGNTVTLDDAIVTKRVYGGYVAFTVTGKASDNTVTINGSSLSEESSMVYGGCAKIAGGEASNNTVTIDASTVASTVFGGSAATATGNKVIIQNGATATGGYNGIAAGYGTTATGNTVIIEGATVSGNVYGGKAYNSGGASTASNNGIIVKSGSILSGATLYAAGSSQSTATFSGNYLTLDGFTGTVAGVRNVDILNINLSTWDADGVVLTLTDEASSLNQLTLNFNILNWDESASGEMTLVSGLTEASIASWNFTTGDGTAAMAADSMVSVKVVENGDLFNVVAYVNEGGGGTASIPEPATATLSLFALAGLAARRRRK